MDFDKTLENEPFLAGAGRTADGLRPLQQKRLRWFDPRKHNVVFFIANVAFLLANVGLMAMTIVHFHHEINVQLPGSQVQDPYSPAHRIAEYKIMNLDMTATKPNAYWGKPRPELDEAWEDLTGSSTIYVSKEEMNIMNKTSIALKDDKGYAGYYAVYHQLHCLKRMYQMNYREYYKQYPFTEEHFQHCMEVLRHSLMCKPDLTLNTMRWELNAPTQFVGETHWARKCINWDSFHAWAGAKRIPSPLTDHMMGPHDVGSFGP